MEINEKLVNGIIERLEGLLGDGGMALTSDNFAINQKVIEDIIFPAVDSFEIDIQEIKDDYNIEVIQSLGRSLSSGRLGYIKNHLQKLLDKLNEVVQK